MGSPDYEGLERLLRERNEIDWVMIANVMDDATAYGLPGTEESAIDYIVGLHEQGKIRVGTYVHGTPEGFIAWEEPTLDLPARLRTALVPTDPDDPLGLVMTVMFTFIDEAPPAA
ncbi:hypothetical protein [Kocuria rosea]|uniref:hypothetical protein n=1 Tax=Kocuria rosea TaxID=1275 RepID=UPI0025B7A4F5|nr:hypothetical protein [Kocuria rosea]WJZ68409.1 hypothetical protein QR564_17685 [Kocuria rosea]